MGCCDSKGSDDKSKSGAKKYSDLQKAEDGANGHHQQVPQYSEPEENKAYANSTTDHNEIDIIEDGGDQQQPQQQVGTGKDDESVASVPEFGEVGEAHGEFKMAKSVAVTLYGEIAVIEHVHERLYLFGKNGVFKQTIASSKDEHREAKLKYPTDVVFTPLGHIAVTDQTRYVKIFNLDGDYLQRFNVKNDEEDPDVKPKAYSLNVAFDEYILVGDIRRKCIVVFKETDVAKSEWISKIKLNIEPHFLATNMSDGQPQILVCDWKAGEVNAVDLSAEENAENVIFKITTFLVDDKPALPKGLACDDDNNIYIAMSRVDESGDDTDKKNVYENTGHIHRYSSDGQFQMCLKKELLHPRGLTWNEGSLYVANTHSILVLNTA